MDVRNSVDHGNRVALGAGAACLACNPASMARPTGAEGAARFSFSVIADFQGGLPDGSTLPADTVREVNLLDPDFTICVGTSSGETPRTRRK